MISGKVIATVFTIMSMVALAKTFKPCHSMLELYMGQLSTIVESATHKFWRTVHLDNAVSVHQSM